MATSREVHQLITSIGRPMIGHLTTPTNTQTKRPTTDQTYRKQTWGWFKDKDGLRIFARQQPGGAKNKDTVAKRNNNAR
eukprot:8880345-Lingulodinium_polyedra.AAC.1